MQRRRHRDDRDVEAGEVGRVGGGPVARRRGRRASCSVARRPRRRSGRRAAPRRGRRPCRSRSTAEAELGRAHRERQPDVALADDRDLRLAPLELLDQLAQHHGRPGHPISVAEPIEAAMRPEGLPIRDRDRRSRATSTPRRGCGDPRCPCRERRVDVGASTGCSSKPRCRRKARSGTHHPISRRSIRASPAPCVCSRRVTSAATLRQGPLDSCSVNRARVQRSTRALRASRDGPSGRPPSVVKRPSILSMEWQ